MDNINTMSTYSIAEVYGAVVQEYLNIPGKWAW